MNRKTTLKDIARETGVHVSTVSRALNPEKRNSLTDEVVEKVAHAAKLLQYHPNRLASGLRTNQTKTVGLVIPDLTNPLFPPIVRGVEKVLEPLGYTSVIVNTDGQKDRERLQLEVLMQHGVDGIIHAAVEREDEYLDVKWLEQMPTVTVNRAVNLSSIPGVINDDATGIFEMFKLLYDAGHRKIAHIAGPQYLTTGVDRLAAFKDVAKKFQIGIPDRYVQKSNKFILEEGIRCTNALLSLDDPPTAILAANDLLALGSLQAMESLGLNCPRNISVTGFNEIDFIDLIPPGLTTVQVDKLELGRASAELLIDMMKNPENRNYNDVIVPIKAIKRGSIASPNR